MNRRLVLGAYGLLLAVALAVGLAEGGGEQASEVPSLSNGGPRGLLALATWLKESGADVRRLEVPLHQLSADVRTLVLPTPRAAIEGGELTALLNYLETGGTLIYLVSRSSGQRALHDALGLTGGEFAAPSADLNPSDLGGATVDVLLPAGLLAGAETLRVSADRTLAPSDERWVPAASHGALYWRRFGRGEVWIAAGADLAENARLPLGDNALFWHRAAAAGPVAFDEFHHRVGSAQGWTANVVATAIQLLFCAALFLLARGSRLGPARPSLRSRHRSVREYIEAMAALAESARVDDEARQRVLRELRHTLWERLGIPVTASPEEAVRELELRTGSATELSQAISGADFLTTSRAAAALQHRVTGLRRHSSGPSPRLHRGA